MLLGTPGRLPEIATQWRSRVIPQQALFQRLLGAGRPPDSGGRQNRQLAILSPKSPKMAILAKGLPRVVFGQNDQIWISPDPAKLPKTTGVSPRCLPKSRTIPDFKAKCLEIGHFWAAQAQKWPKKDPPPRAFWTFLPKMTKRTKKLLRKVPRSSRIFLEPITFILFQG